ASWHVQRWSRSRPTVPLSPRLIEWTATTKSLLPPAIAFMGGSGKVTPHEGPPVLLVLLLLLEELWPPPLPSMVKPRSAQLPAAITAGTSIAKKAREGRTPSF